LFPNPKLTEGSGEVKAGQTYWLPSKQGERWYVLDDNPGEETIYLLASRDRNLKIEQLYENLGQASTDKLTAPQVEDISAELERRLNIMGFADFTVPKVEASASFNSKEALFESLKNEAKVPRADAIVKLTFKHVPR
jgi:hypothetical protein